MFLPSRSSSLPFLLVAVAALGAPACGGSASPSADHVAAGGAAGAATNDGGPQASDAASAGTTSGGPTGAGGTLGDSVIGAGAPTTSVTAPGKFTTNPSTPGSGPCAGVTLADLLDEIRAGEPTLADVKTVYNPALTSGDGSFIYAYARPDGGFDIVFKLGVGDCQAGCLDNAYTYFATNASCQPANVGHYHAAWGTANCLVVDGAPMWNHPTPPDPLTVCGQDNAPQDLRGMYLLHASGQLTPCSTTAVKVAAIDTTVTLVVEQDAKDLGTGFVTFTGTGHAFVDGVRQPARFQRRRFDAALQSSNLPNMCPREQSVTSRYDFENYQPGGIEVTELGDDACTQCKGSMSLTLTSTTITQVP